MALFNSLLRYKGEGRLLSFDMISEKKAKVRIARGREIVIYMSDYYIVGLAEVREAVEAPKADFMLYNNWDMLAAGASAEGRRVGVEIYKFGAFGHKLDEMNAGLG
jgi:hypothetical protein